MRAPIQMQQLPKTGPRLAPAAMATARAVFLDQAGGLQGVFHEAVGHRHAMLPARDLMEVPHVEPGILRPIQAQHLLDLQGRDRKSTRLNSSHLVISYAVFCLKKKYTY